MGACCGSSSPILKMVVSKTTKLTASELGSFRGLLASTVTMKGHRVIHQRVLGEIDSQLEIVFQQGDKTHSLKKFGSAEELTQEAVIQIVAQIDTLSSSPKRGDGQAF